MVKSSCAVFKLQPGAAGGDELKADVIKVDALGEVEIGQVDLLAVSYGLDVGIGGERYARHVDATCANVHNIITACL